MKKTMRNPLVTTAILTAALLATALLTGCAAKSQNNMTFDELAYGKDINKFTPEQHEHLGDSYASRNQPEMAFVHYNKAIEADPKNIELLSKKGTLLMKEQAAEQALKTYRKMLDLAPENAQANEGAGLVLYNAGLDKEATEHLQKAVAADPTLWRAHTTLGILYGKQGNIQNAAMEFDQALESAPFQERPEILNNIGVLYMAEKDYTRAMRSFQEALSQGAVSPTTCNNLGLALIHLDRLDEALDAFRTAGGEAKAYNNLGFVLMKKGHAAQAVPYFERALELSPTFYHLASENLRQAKMIVSITGKENSSTPNTLHLSPIPEVQNPDGPAASSDAAGPSPLTEKSLPKSQKRYGLHAGSWQDPKKAQKYCLELEKQGYETFIKVVDLKEKGIWFRVLVGNYETKQEATGHKPDVLKALHLDSMLVSPRTGQYTGTKI